MLYDIYVPDGTLPWVINVRSQNYPSELVRPTKDTMRNIFLQAVKEADQLKHKGEVISSMTHEDHNRLFDSIVNSRAIFGNSYDIRLDKFDDFWTVNRRLMDDEAHKIAHIPIRFYEVGVLRGF